MRIDSVRALGVGVSLPQDVRYNGDWRADIVEQWRKKAAASTEPQGPVIDALMAQAAAAVASDPFRGTRERRVAAADKTPSFYELEAARQAIANAGLQPSDIDMLLIHSVVPDEVCPHNGPTLHWQLGLKSAAPAISVDGACCSFVHQVLLAAPLITAGGYRKVLLVQSQLGSRIADMDSPNSVIFGDAASAVVLGRGQAGQGILAAKSYMDGHYADEIVVAPGAQQRTWTKGGPAFTVQGRDREVHREFETTLSERMARTFAELLDEAGLSRKNVDVVVSNQSFSGYGEVCRKAAGFVNATTVNTFDTVGSVSAACIPVNLQRASEMGLLGSGKVVAAFATGAGLHWGALLMRT